MLKDKRILNFIVIALFTSLSMLWTSFIFHQQVEYSLLLSVIVLRSLSSLFIFKDYSLSWSKATQKTFLIKSIVNIVAFLVYLPIFYGDVRFAYMASELFFYLFSITFLMYSYYYLINRSNTKKIKSVVIYGAGKAGIKLASEFAGSEFKVLCFIDDNETLQKRSIDNVNISSSRTFRNKNKGMKFDLLIIAMPSADKKAINKAYDCLQTNFTEIQILPSLNDILQNNSYLNQLKNISVEDLLARHPQDLDKTKISEFIKGKTVLVSGAGGSIGSEICRQCQIFGVKKLILLDHSEYNLYAITEGLLDVEVISVMQSVVNKEALAKTFKIHMPDIVIHAAAYKHVPLVESNINEGIINNIIGTKNIIDTSIQYNVSKFVMISTDKAVRPTNVMGTTKRICELYAQNSNGKGTDIVAVRFGNVLGSSGSVIPKFKAQIENGKNITVTHPDITRYFMLIPEACELVLQAGAIGTGGEIFILDMGEPIKIVDLAKKMIELSGKEDVQIEFSGLRPGEKLYEELLIDDSDASTDYESITVATPTYYDIKTLNKDINELLACENQLEQLKVIVPEFNHQLN
ncbi:polysaccharide biosynthesis protein [Sulfurimonas sp. SAG-AH-194-I05]|nr:nucleoside-diphosphate sugar epimerase/dehydratase [Sulfurimonas sp. SAG-AH-194-I05]MDF1875186.1 polysaccharide biosynthesis protein [Sulfurimonas sp. SAG-AH-194-I05]